MNPLSLFYTVRSYVEAYAGFLGMRFLTLIWVVAICVVIWFYAPLLGYGGFTPLASVGARLITIGVVLVAWLIYFVVSIIRGRRRDKALVDDISADPEALAESQNKAEVLEIRNRLKQALALLRKVTKKRFGYVYQLPWYMIVGAPGSGKTTALTNSGLKFPLGDALGDGAVQGVGGTRNCNWWFTEDAILIDTAGRYTTQDDLATTSKAGWEGFLKLLKKHRTSQPVNGVIVTLSINDILTRSPDARMEEVRAIRKRLAELDEFLRARVPVYLILTKADLLTGFVEFFDGLNKSDREQVWGMTFDLDESYKTGGLPARFLDEYALLQERVGAMLLERLQQEPNNETRGRIFAFPAQLASLKEALHEILTELCTGSRLVEGPLIRGLYFASGTQQDDTVAVRPQAQRMRRSYFLSRLFSDVIFGEAALVARDRRLSRRQLLVRRIGYAAASLVVAVVLASWILTYFHNTNAIARAEDRIGEYQRLSQGIPVRDVADTDFLQVLPALNALAAVPDGFRGERIWSASFGLDQEQKIEGRHRAAYQRALNALLLPRLMVYLQNGLKDISNVPETFDNLKLYGMLGGLGPMEPDFVATRSKAIFEEAYPGDGRLSARRALENHVQAMTVGMLPPIDLDPVLVAKARQAIANVTLAGRAYDILRTGQQVRQIAPWSAAALGPSMEQTFERTSKAPLREGVPGLYTRLGFQAIVLPEIDAAARQAIGEYWVRGEQSQGNATISDVGRDAMQLYLGDFQRAWNKYLTDMRIRTPNDIADASEVARLLAAEPNPITIVSQSVADATNLGAQTIAGTEVASADATGPETLIVETGNLPDPYAGLREALKAPADGQSQIAALKPVLDALYDQLSRASTSTAAVAEVFNVDGQLTQANQKLLSEARRFPRPVDVWVAGFAADIGELAAKTARRSIGELWETNGAPICKAAVAGRYPFDRSSNTDIALDDFVRLFGPDGLFDKFFKDRLAAFVDTTASPWRWRGSLGTEGTASDALAQFERADLIRRAFFPLDGTDPAVTINVTPAELSQESNAVMVEIEGERVVYFHGPVRSKSIVWPSKEAANLSRVAFQPGGWDQALTRNGDWSPFRLFDAAEIIDEKDNRFRARFTQGGQAAEFDIQFGSALNPFRLSAVSDFDCPSGL